MENIVTLSDISAIAEGKISSFQMIHEVVLLSTGQQPNKLEFILEFILQICTGVFIAHGVHEWEVKGCHNIYSKKMMTQLNARAKFSFQHLFYLSNVIKMEEKNWLNILGLHKPHLIEILDTPYEKNHPEKKFQNLFLYQI